jgi:CelD/BcsL family acetyltransferase involved in cellulose biosynthesis
VSDYRLEIHSGKKGLEYLFSDWLAMAECLEHPGPSHFPSWYTAFLARPDAADTAVFFITIYRGSRLVAVFPVGIKRTRRFNLVELTVPVNEMLDVLPDAVVGRDEDHSGIFRFFLKAMKFHPEIKWDVLVVSGTLQDSHISKCLRGVQRQLTMHTQTGYCNYIRVDQFKDKQAVPSRNLRANLRKAKNQIEKTGSLEFDCVSDLPAVMEAVSAFVDLEASGWKGMSQHNKQQYYAGSALALNESKLSFHQDIARAFAKDGYVEAYKLLLDGKIISLDIAVILGSTCYLLKIVYDESYAKFSPGNLLLKMIIEHHVQDANVSTINLISEYSWHSAWKPSKLEYVTYQCFNSTLSGVTYFIGKHIQAALSRLKSPTEK